MNCTESPSGEHEYNPNDYSRDDMGFYVECIHCKQSHFFEADTEEDLYGVFELGDDD